MAAYLTTVALPMQTCELQTCTSNTRCPYSEPRCWTPKHPGYRGTSAHTCPCPREDGQRLTLWRAPNRLCSVSSVALACDADPCILLSEKCRQALFAWWLFHACLPAQAGLHCPIKLICFLFASGCQLQGAQLGFPVFQLGHPPSCRPHP